MPVILKARVYYTAEEAAGPLGVLPRAVRGLCERGTLRGAVRTPGYHGVWLIPAESLEEELRRREEKSG